MGEKEEEVQEQLQKWNEKVKECEMAKCKVMVMIDFEVPELLTGTLKSEIEVCERNSFKICDFHPIKEEHEEDYATPFFLIRRSNGHTPRATLSASVATVR
ncbi:unnamed protein product [Timema podura]|uniref:Uncharacterized protein n=1 Tax=Timema podura TaxID=61482 RepID=A0ABN7NQA6_TIMPD|nr:unnamed protein product [Timema podura]